MLFIEYPKCSTCQRAGKWLEEHGAVFERRHIVEKNPTKEELKQWHQMSGLPLKRFFQHKRYEVQRTEAQGPSAAVERGGAV